MEENRTLFEVKATEWAGHMVRVFVVNGFQIRGKLIAADSGSILVEEDKQKKEMLVTRENITTMEELYEVK